MSYFSNPACWICEDRKNPHLEVVNWAEKLFFMTMTVRNDRKRLVLTKTQYDDSINRRVPFQVCCSHWKEVAKHLMKVLKMRYPLDSIDKKAGEDLLKLIWIIDEKKIIKDLELLERNAQLFTAQYWHLLDIPAEFIPQKDPKRHPKEPSTEPESEADDDDVEEISLNISRHVRVKEEEEDDEAGPSTSGPRPPKRRHVTFEVQAVQPEVQEPEEPEEEDEEHPSIEVIGVQPRSFKKCNICQQTAYTKELSNETRLLALFLAPNARSIGYDEARAIYFGEKKRLFICHEDLKKGAQALRKLLKVNDYCQISKTATDTNRNVFNSMKKFATRNGNSPAKFAALDKWPQKWRQYVRNYIKEEEQEPSSRRRRAVSVPLQIRHRPPPVAPRQPRRAVVPRRPRRDLSEPLSDEEAAARAMYPEFFRKDQPSIPRQRSRRYPAFWAVPRNRVFKRVSKSPTPVPVPRPSAAPKPSIIRIIHPNEACGAGSSGATFVSMPKVITPPKALKVQKAPPPRVPKATVPLPTAPSSSSRSSEEPPMASFLMVNRRRAEEAAQAARAAPERQMSLERRSSQEPGPSTSRSQKSPSISSVTSDAYHTPPETPILQKLPKTSKPAPARPEPKKPSTSSSRTTSSSKPKDQQPSTSSAAPKDEPTRLESPTLRPRKSARPPPKH